MSEGRVDEQNVEFNLAKMLKCFRQALKTPVEYLLDRSYDHLSSFDGQNLGFARIPQKGAVPAPDHLVEEVKRVWSEEGVSEATVKADLLHQEYPDDQLVVQLLEELDDAAIVERREAIEGDAEIVVSAIVSVYNARKFIADCLTNLFSQEIAEQMEIIIIDSGSPEREIDIIQPYLEEFPSRIRYLRTHREGLYVAWNRGLRAARGRYFVNANCDDRVRPDAYFLLSNALDQNPESALAYADCGLVDKTGPGFDEGKIFLKTNLGPYNPAVTLFYCYSGCVQFWRTSSIRSLGGYRSDMVAVGDYEILSRMVVSGMRAEYVPETLSLFFQNVDGISQMAGSVAVLEFAKIQRYIRGEIQIEKYLHSSLSSKKEQIEAWEKIGKIARNGVNPWSGPQHSSLRDPPFAVFCFLSALKQRFGSLFRIACSI